MIPISSYLIDQVVTLTLTTWGQDVDGGRIPSGTTARPDVPAAVLPGKPIRLAAVDPNTGLMRITESWPVTVLFDCDQGLAIEDLIAWEDPAGRTHTYQVRGYGPDAGQPDTWTATCEERR